MELLDYGRITGGEGGGGGGQIEGTIRGAEAYSAPLPPLQCIHLTSSRMNN